MIDQDAQNTQDNQPELDAPVIPEHDPRLYEYDTNKGELSRYDIFEITETILITHNVQNPRMLIERILREVITTEEGTHWLEKQGFVRENPPEAAPPNFKNPTGIKLEADIRYEDGVYCGSIFDNEMNVAEGTFSMLGGRAHFQVVALVAGVPLELSNLNQMVVGQVYHCIPLGNPIDDAEFVGTVVRTA